MFNLSVVNIAPDAHKDAINQIAELYGCGSNNLSVNYKVKMASIGAVIHGGSLKITHYSVMMNYDSR